MIKEEIAKRFCKFESCTHRNGEGTCCLFNQDNCIFHRLEKENAELKEELKNWKDEWQEQLREQVEAMKCCENCKHYSASCCCNLPFDDCFELSAWELRK